MESHCVPVQQRPLVCCHTDYCRSSHSDTEKSNMGLICVTVTELYNNRCIYETLRCLRSICKALLGLTVTLQSHCVPGCPPVFQWLGHSGPVCQLVDICLLPPPSVVMAAKPPHHHHQTRSPPLAGRPSPPLSRVSPRHQL